MKRHGCMLTYLLYLALYLVYFILIGKLLSNLSFGIKSDDLLAITLFISFVFAALTASIIMYWKKILNYIRSKVKSSS